jgi:peptide/nickel transport system substrate-binding protein
LQTAMRRDPALSVVPIDRNPNPAVLRLNHLHPPFDDPAARRALLPAIVQADFMAAIVGDDPALYRTDLGVFEPGTPLATTAGLDVLTGPRSMDRARQLLRDAGATGPVTRLIGPTDILSPSAMTQVCADLFHRLGLNLDVALSDWGTVIQRRNSREPVEKGGWSAFLTAFGSFDFADPAGHPALRGNGTAGWYGWPTIPRLETLRDAWFAAPDLGAQQAVAVDIQRVVLDEVAFIPVGAYSSITALRSNLVDRVQGFALFYGLRRG